MVAVLVKFLVGLAASKGLKTAAAALPYVELVVPPVTLLLAVLVAWLAGGPVVRVALVLVLLNDSVVAASLTRKFVALFPPNPPTPAK